MSRLSPCVGSSSFCRGTCWCALYTDGAEVSSRTPCMAPFDSRRRGPPGASSSSSIKSVPERPRSNDDEQPIDLGEAASYWTGSNSSPTVFLMTAKEQLRSVVDDLSEDEAATALMLVERGRDE